MLVTSKQMLLDAQAGGYAVGAFNIENMEMAQAAIAAAEALRSPILLQTTPGTLKYADTALYLANVKALAEKATVPVAMHLDHGSSFQQAMSVYRAGYTSIMIDGSKLPFEENIALTAKVVEVCHCGNVPVEAELGMVGGKEDGMEGGNMDIYTDPDQAAEFVQRTGVDFLAVGIGTAHGVYKGEPKLDVERLSQIRAKVSVPLVLHGTSGVPDDVVRDCIRRGICKVNYATDLRIAYTKAVRETLENDPAIIDPKKFGAAGRKAVQACVEGRIRVCGSEGKA